MRGWRVKLIFMLVVYFAGFATAIYCLAPVPEEQANQKGNKSLKVAMLESDDFARSFNVRLHKGLGVAKDAVARAGTFIKQKIDEYESRTDG